MIETFLLPFQFGFMRQAFVITLLIAVPMALLSCFLVLKGWSLMGDAISHAVLPGIVVAYIVNLPLALGAFVAGMVCALATGFLKENSRVKEDTVMGVVFSGMFGLGIVLYTKIQSAVRTWISSSSATTGRSIPSWCARRARWRNRRCAS